MSHRRINVLVYSGNGTTFESVRQCLYSLQRLLHPNYAVFSVTERMILHEPWTTSCALLVLPGGADTAYCSSLNGNGNRIIDQYVRRGGAYLGCCAGGYYGSSRCEFEIGNKLMEVIGNRELSFFPGTCRGCAFKGFVYNSEAGAKAVELKVLGESFNKTTKRQNFRCYYNGGGVFVDAGLKEDSNLKVLASYVDPLSVDGGDGSAAVIYHRVGEGRVILTGPHLEFSPVNLSRQKNGPAYEKLVDSLLEHDNLRIAFLSDCLEMLGLRTGEQKSSFHLLSPLHISSLQCELIPHLLLTWKPIIMERNGQSYIEGDNDTFHIEKYNNQQSQSIYTNELPLSGLHIPQAKLESGQTNMNQQARNHCNSMKQIILHECKWPKLQETPHFNHNEYYANLEMYQAEKGKEVEDFGKYLIYADVVDSTNTMLEKNMKLVSHTPSGLTFIATTQLEGRGRGSNVWISPTGSLAMSVCIRHPMSLSNLAPIIFIQYIASMAIIEGIQSYGNGCEKIPVKLKWPNDIYAADSSRLDSNKYIKIGGVLAKSSYMNGVFDIVVGIGLNIEPTAPTTSLNSLCPSDMPPFTLERLLPRILTCFESLYRRFCRNGFDHTFEKLYYGYWLHTNQVVTLADENSTRARIKGITPDFGLLKVEELGWDDRPTGKILTLQSDCNSFDFFKGLLKTKA
ncbi:BgTH12-07268 [Blumeria graminis f. sp. triticale]|uniref:BgTH12-07268 n=1 Tax=Blumeria graminis f. sp. triticale TaxID=1689686 RepID=A0A9W4DDD4_BLUGR|nr:BgTH12-07268 [Blumeria graminis f. sp. triticale]